MRDGTPVIIVHLRLGNRRDCRDNFSPTFVRQYLSHVSKAKLKEEIKKHCEINNLAHVLFTNQTKTIAGKKAKVWKKVKALKGDDDYLGVILGS